MPNAFHCVGKHKLGKTSAIPKSETTYRFHCIRDNQSACQISATTKSVPVDFCYGIGLSLVDNRFW